MVNMHLTSFEQVAIWAVFAVAWIGLGYAVFLRSQILREDKGTDKMQEVWNAIKDEIGRASCRERVCYPV